MKAVVVATDIAPSQALSKLADELKKRNYEVVRFLGSGKEIIESVSIIEQSIDGAQVVIVGMSSSPELASKEISVVKCAKLHGIPVFLFADTFNVHNRPWFLEVMDKVNLFHVNELQASLAQDTFPSINVIPTGNPNWENFFFPKLTRDEVRNKLNINHDTKVILCPGGKNTVVNILHFGKAIELASDIPEVNIEIVISIHPGDRTDLGLYQDLVKYSDVKVSILTKDTISGEDILPGVDLVFESASTIGITAVCQRIPVIEYFSKIARKRLEESTGSADWFLTGRDSVFRDGPAFDLESYEGLGVAKTLVRDLLLSTEKKTFFLERAEKWFPRTFATGEAIGRMVSYIQSVVR